MRKSYIVVLAVIVLGLAATYSVVSTDISSLVGLKTTGLSPDMRIINAVALDSQAIPAPIASANNEFAIKFYKQIANTDENIFFSPISIYTTFSLLYEGARFDTASQMQDVFGFEPDYMIRHNQTAHMLSILSREDQHTKLELANALWLADWIEPYPRFLDATYHTYLAQAESVDFTTFDSVDKINEWSSEKTREKIKKVSNSDINNMTAIAINNVIYFKMKWLFELHDDFDSQTTFHLNSTHSVESNIIYETIPLDRIHSHGSLMSKLPYEGDELGSRLSMLIILPDETDGIGQLEEILSADLVKQWIDKLEESSDDDHNEYLSRITTPTHPDFMRWSEIPRVESKLNHSSPSLVGLSIPRFEFKTSYDLDMILANMGMYDAFDEQRADLLGLAPTIKGNYHVTQAIQDAYVQISGSGTGTEAGPFSSGSYAPQEEPRVKIKIDHPFIFIIYEEQSGTILLMGRVSDPTA